MSSFIISTNTSAGQLLDSGEFGFMAPDGSILAPVGSAVILSDTATLISYGAMASATASGLLLNAVANTSVTIAASGSVVTGGVDLAAVSGTFKGFFAVHNAGMISGGQGISLMAAQDRSQINIANDGSLQGLGVSAGAAISLVLNQTSTGVITNTGTLSTAGMGPTVNVMGGGTLTLTNTGNLLNASALQSAIQVAGGLTLRNAGLIEGNVTATQSANIFNSGRIEGNITLNSYNDYVRVSGLVMGDITLGNGVNAFVLTGGHVMGNVIGGHGNDTYRVDSSDVAIIDTGGGIDRVFSSADFRLSSGVENLFLTGAHGLVGIGSAQANQIVGDKGDDTIRGSGGGDLLDGGEGNNKISGGSGDDTLQSGDGDDYLWGGSGDDVFNISGGTDRIYGGQGSNTLSFANLTDPAGVSANLTTHAFSFADAGKLRIRDAENLTGSAFGDTLSGDAQDNVISGGGGADRLYGGLGNDRLIGGAGGDLLGGGGDTDSFVFKSVTDSTTGSGSDTIQGFEVAGDVIDLSAIDAAPGGGDDAFVFLGTGDFTGSAAEVRYTHVGGTTLVEVRLAGSVVDDMQIVVNGVWELTPDNFDL